MRMHDNRIPKQLLYGELSLGKRKVGGQKKPLTDNVKVSLKDFKPTLRAGSTLGRAFLVV